MINNDRKMMKKFGFLMLLIIPILIYLPFYINGEIPGTADFVKYVASKSYVVQCLLNGEFPQWNRYVSNGMPQAALTNFYFISDVFFLLPVREAVFLFFVFHLFVGSLFFYLYLRESGCSYLTSMVFAVIYECSIQINGMRRTHPTVIVSICLFPVIMYFIKKFFHTRQTRWFCLSAVTCAIQATSMQQYSIYANLVLVVYILMFCIHEKVRIFQIIKMGVMWVAVYVGIFAYAFFPLLSVIRGYAEYGSTSITYDDFRSYSVHPVKILQMIIPKIFGEIYMPFGVYESSEMDIELYLGIFVLVFAILTVAKYRNDWKIKIELICAVFAFAYASIAHIPFLGELVYKIPLLGGFRCAGRMLYIFYFFTFSLAAKGLDNTCKKASFAGCVKVLKRMIFIIFLGILCLGVIGGIAASFTDPGLWDGYFSEFENRLLLPVCYSAVILIVLSLLRRKMIGKRNFTREWKRRFLCASLLVITLAEVLPFSTESQTTSLAQLESENAFVENMKESVGTYKVWDALVDISSEHTSIVTQNKGQVSGISAINVYTAYNNPLIYRYFKNVEEEQMAFNSSALLTGSHNIRNNVMIQNDLLSMLGIKYLIDSSGVIENTNGTIFDSQCDAIPLFFGQNLTVETGEDGMGVCEVLGGVQEATCYKITIVVNKEDNNRLSYLGVDLYGGESYDPEFQQKNFTVTEQGNRYVAYLCPDSVESVTEDIRLRILAGSDAGDIRIEACEVTAVLPREAYRLWGEDVNGTKIYENVNAKDILYFPDEVKRKKSFEDIYKNCDKYQLDTKAYVDRKSRDLRKTVSTVSISSYRSNSLEAEVVSDSKTYLCFSQNYSSNWSVSIDGKEKELDMVNGLIMGVEMPAGHHTVVFTYHDVSYVIGAAITLFTVIVLLFFFVAGRKFSKSCDNA